MDFNIYTKGGHGPQPMDPWILYMFSIEGCSVILGVSNYESQDVDFQVIDLLFLRNNCIWGHPKLSTVSLINKTVAIFLSPPPPPPRYD